jgi:hypothetical protein
MAVGRAASASRERLVIHTYRDPNFEKSDFFALVLVYAVLVIFGWMGIAALPVPPSIAWALFGAFPMWLLGALYVAHRSSAYGTCGEIHLSDDGTCVLKTRRRVIRLQVNEIRSVQYSYDHSEASGSYAIHYQGGKLDVSDNMTGFLDFMSSLRRLNPAVDLTSFPAGRLPSVSAPATEKPPLLRRITRS